MKKTAIAILILLVIAANAYLTIKYDAYLGFFR